MSDRYGNDECRECWPHDDSDCICDACQGTGYVKAEPTEYVVTLAYRRPPTVGMTAGLKRMTLDAARDLVAYAARRGMPGAHIVNADTLEVTR